MNEWGNVVSIEILEERVFFDVFYYVRLVLFILNR